MIIDFRTLMEKRVEALNRISRHIALENRRHAEYEKSNQYHGHGDRFIPERTGPALDELLTVLGDFMGLDPIELPEGRRWTVKPELQAPEPKPYSEDLELPAPSPDRPNVVQGMFGFDSIEHIGPDETRTLDLHAEDDLIVRRIIFPGTLADAFRVEHIRIGTQSVLSEAFPARILSTDHPNRPQLAWRIRTGQRMHITLTNISAEPTRGLVSVYADIQHPRLYNAESMLKRFAEACKREAGALSPGCGAEARVLQILARILKDGLPEVDPAQLTSR